MTADEVIAAARSALGTPFRHQGRTVGQALDCAGMIIHVVRVLGIAHADQAGYGRRPSGGLLEAALDGQPGLTRVGDMRPGDVLLLRFSGDPQHLAVFTGENLIHAYQPVGKVCEHRLDADWRGRIVRIYRFAGVVHGE